MPNNSLFVMAIDNNVVVLGTYRVSSILTGP